MSKTLPNGFIEMVNSLPGHEGLVEALSLTESPVSIRLNPHKPIGTDDLATAERVPWEKDGVYLPSRPQFTFHPALYDGRFYVQDASSMIVGHIVRRLTEDVTKPMVYLDACAAPGGKTIAALSALPAGSFVLANEYDRSRVNALVDNLDRWGDPLVAVSNTDARKICELGETFDIVAADVPCSGEGMMRKNETAVTQWSLGLVEQCASLQREIVDSLWRTLNPGGYFIYSTCTFNCRENEDNAEWIRDELGAEPIDLELEQLPGVMKGLSDKVPCARFLPGRVKGEGQFVAVFRKPGSTTARPRYKDLKKIVDLPDWLKGDYDGVGNKNGDIFAVSRDYSALVRYIGEKINLIVPGLHVASPKGRDLVPAPALAHSLALKDDAFPEAGLTYGDAIHYLRGEAVRLPDDIPKGIVLVKYEDCRLGWVKNLGSRANNLMPSAQRIKSSYAPEKCPNLMSDYST